MRRTAEFAKWLRGLRDAKARARVELLLLVGGDKSSQQRDIERAKKINAEYE